MEGTKRSRGVLQRRTISNHTKYVDPRILCLFLRETATKEVRGEELCEKFILRWQVASGQVCLGLPDNCLDVCKSVVVTMDRGVEKKKKKGGTKQQLVCS